MLLSAEHDRLPITWSYSRHDEDLKNVQMWSFHKF